MGMKENPRIAYLLHLADNALILGHRNSEWCGHGPVLEQDIALTNLSLDQLGQARQLYQLAARMIGGGATEDTLAYLRDVRGFRNCLMLELPKGDWGFTVMRQYLFSLFQHIQYKALCHSTMPELAAIAEKSIKESTYHVRWSREWVVRLGDGTEESAGRMRKAVEVLWPYCGELFIPSIHENSCAAEGIGPDPTTLRDEWMHDVRETFEEARLETPREEWSQKGGKEGMHTEHLGFLLAEMQYLQRAYPGNEW